MEFKPVTIIERKQMLEKQQAGCKPALCVRVKIDVLVNNAGRSQRCLADETPTEVDRAIMELNFFAPVALTRTVLPHMISRRQGHLVVTSSVAGKMGEKCIVCLFVRNYCHLLLLI